MSFTPAEAAACERLARLALDEDLGTAGDLTSAALIPPDLQGQAAFVARSPAVVAGLPAVRIVCLLVDDRLALDEQVADGSRVEAGTRLAIVRGAMRSLLAAERTALNFLQRL